MESDDLVKREFEEIYFIYEKRNVMIDLDPSVAAVGGAN